MAIHNKIGAKRLTGCPWHKEDGLCHSPVCSCLSVANDRFTDACRDVCITANDKPGDALSAICVALELVKLDRVVRELEMNHKEPSNN